MIRCCLLSTRCKRKSFYPKVAPVGKSGGSSPCNRLPTAATCFGQRVGIRALSPFAHGREVNAFEVGITVVAYHQFANEPTKLTRVGGFIWIHHPLCRGRGPVSLWTVFRLHLSGFLTTRCKNIGGLVGAVRRDLLAEFWNGTKTNINEEYEPAKMSEYPTQGCTKAPIFDL